MTATHLFTLISAEHDLYFVVLIAVLFLAVTLLLMQKDYRLYREDHIREGGWADFLRREQFYLYLLLLFFLIVGGELWRRYCG